MKKKEHQLKSPLWRFFLVLFTFSMSFSLYAQEITTTGTVVDQNGEPLIGVTVSVMKGSNGTITDIDGNFSIKSNKGATLKFSYIGYKDVTQVAMGTKMNIVLTEDAQALDEVVVVGYGTSKKRDLTGAISTVSAKTIEERQPTDIYQALQGEVSGLQISNNSGAPGDTGTMLIRGASTMGSGANPLFIVDGVAVDNISTINPADIQSMEVLKDAASAAIYGSRAAAGVIIITTKRGKEGAPARVSIKYNHSIKNLSHKLDQANAFERYLKERAGNAGTSLWKTSNDSLHPNFMADNDYQDLVTRTAHSDQLDINISGAKNKISYYTSIGYLNEQGIVLNSYMHRLTSRTNVDFAVSDRFKLMSRFNVSWTNKNNISTGSVLNQALRRPPQMALYFPDGTYVFNNGGQFNPIADAYMRINETTAYDIQLYQGAEFQLMKGLVWSANVQGNLRLNRTDQLTPGKLVSSGTTTGKNNATIKRKLSAETYINWAKDFGDHSVGAMGGTSIEDWYDEDFNLEGSEYVSESIISTNAQQVKNLTNTKTGFSDHAMASFFGRVNYSYKGKYIFVSNLRYDGSSRFVGKRWGLFPSASAAWRFSDEFFFDWAKPILTDAKFRASWGTNGNEQVGNYESINQYEIGGYYNGAIAVKQTSKLANVNLSWESTEQTNIGLDLTLLNGRVSVTAEYYIKKTKDLLADEVMPSELGISSMRVNLGNIENRGIELSISGYPIQTQDFSWQTTINFSKNKNKVLKLSEGKGFLEDGKYWIEEGSPLGQWFGQKYLGIYRYDESNAYVKNGDGSFGDRLVPVFHRDPNNYNNIIYGSNGKPILSHYETQGGQKYDGEVGKMTANNIISKGGDVIWDDRDHDGKIDDSDRRILGNGMPTWYLNWSNYLNYKNFSLSFSFYGSFGNKIYNKQRRDLLQNSSSNMTPLARDCYALWKYQGHITPVYSSANATKDVNNARELSSMFLEDGDYIRLTNARLAYRVDPKISKRFFVSDLQVYVYGNNLLTWTKYKGFDPSSISNSNVLRPGNDSGRYPTAREIGLGLNINF
ncbi:SusC/RagA family TonB-linked outer membrane protein [Bacteroides oleiciplenus]|uniref:SusC/RagA family TonB-linked outer membrane protein n=1 Tax=Bacteroides oleiciplenus YIT 12058 TaxID=742727 RepID=K9EIL8_9BACE|nr:TonB-dependent receptor [Bacteroides oleiciplenus]EKU88975.1 SusC/RagA family TonB-linked outer membrane protein [Bacteroides oleiciplenus YIT 12058]